MGFTSLPIVNHALLQSSALAVTCVAFIEILILKWFTAIAPKLISLFM